MTWYNSAGVLDADNMLHTGANLVWSTNLTDLIRIGRDPRYSSLSAMWSIEAFCSGYFGQQIFNEPYCTGGIGLNENWTAGVKLAVGLIAPLEHVKGVFLGVRTQTFAVCLLLVVADFRERRTSRRLRAYRGLTCAS